MEFRLLGPVEVWDGTEPVRLGGHKPRILLTALLLDQGRVVPADRLVDAIWGDEPPDTARALVQTYVSSLRRALARPGEPDVIETRPPGYSLRAGSHEIDRDAFIRKAAAAREAAADGRHDEAAKHFALALEQWRGPALSGIGSALLAGEAARLDELRLTVIEERCEVELIRRRYEDLVSDLTGLVEQHPTREGLRRQLMLALYRCGRQADALAVYRAGRAALIAELGIEPGPALRSLHESILRGDEAPPDTAGPSRVEVVDAPRPVPAQLPAVPTDFTGRAAALGTLVEALTPSAAGVPTVVLSGKGGAGKSTLAALVAHRLGGAYPDGQLYVQLHGMSPTPSSPEEILGRFLVALGDPAPGLEVGLDERVERYRSLVAGQRILVVLDDAANEGQVRPLLPGQPGCAALITARGRLAGLAGAGFIELDVLARDETDELLARLVGPDRVAAEPAAAKRLADLCGGLPLAVRIVGARLAIRKHWSLERLSTRLADERRRLDELAVGDQEVRSSIALSYRALDGQARTALRRLGLLGLPDFAMWVVAALLDLDEDTGEEVVERLVDGQFLDYAGTDGVGQARYQLHDLLRLYAGERADAEEDAGVRDAAVRRVMSGWLELIDRIVTSRPTGGMLLRTTLGAPGTAPPGPLRAALADPRGWFEAERHALVASVERAAALDLDDVAAELASALCGSLFITDNLFDAWRRTHDAALAAVRRAGNRPAEAALLAEVGQLRYEQDRYAEARTYLLQALAAFRECQDVRGEAATLAALGTACREQGYLPEALHFLNQAEAVFTELADEPAGAYVWRLRGSVHLELGDFPAARSDLEAAVATFRRTGSRRGEAITLRTVGLLHRALGEYERSYDLCVQARAIFRELGDELLEAYGTRSVVKAELRLGRAREGREALEHALEVCRARGDRWGEAMTLRTLGDLHLSAGRLAEAEGYLTGSLRLWQALDLPLGRARTLRDLARLARAGGDAQAAGSRLDEAMEIFRLYGTREVGELAAEPPTAL